MAGEARKAAERVMAEIREKAMVMDMASDWHLNETKAIEVIEKEVAATIEQCAQIAESTVLRKWNSPPTKYNYLTVTQLRTNVAAAIRSIPADFLLRRGQNRGVAGYELAFSRKPQRNQP